MVLFSIIEIIGNEVKKYNYPTKGKFTQIVPKNKNKLKKKIIKTINK